MLTQTVKIRHEINQVMPKGLTLETAHDKALYALMMGYSTYVEDEPVKDFNVNPIVIHEALNVIRQKPNFNSTLFMYGEKKEAMLSLFKLKFAEDIIQVDYHSKCLEVHLNRLIDVEYHLPSLTELRGTIYHLGSHEVSAVYQRKYYRYSTCSLINLYYLLKYIPNLTIQDLSVVALLESLSKEHQEACIHKLSSTLVQTTLSELTYEGDFYHENLHTFQTFSKILENNTVRSVWKLKYKIARLIGV